MYNKNYYSGKKITSDFMEERESYLHSGVDYLGKKTDNMFCQIDGMISAVKNSLNYYGKQIVVRSNPSFAGGIDEDIYHDYCHLYKVWVAKVGRFVQAGEALGKIGNSGGTYTNYGHDGKITKKWRKVTDKEKIDIYCNYGSHAHIGIYQLCEEKKETELLKELKQRGIVDGKDYFWQWGKLYYSPEKIYEYFEALKKEK